MTSAIKDIVVLLDGSNQPSDDLRAGLALHLSHHHGASLTGLYVGGTDDFEEAYHGDGRGTTLDDTIEVAGISEPTGPRRRSSRISASEELFLEASGGLGRWQSALTRDEVLRAARCADLVIAGPPGRADAARSVEWEDVAVQAGRPVLAVPGTFQSLPSGGRHLGRRALIGWNRSPEAARAVHDALPFLRRTEETIVLSVVDGMDEAGGREEAEQLVSHLRRHEVPARALIETSGPYIDLGGLLLDRVRENGCDLLVMGAYSRSRLHESWLGGASHEVFTRMTVPVLTSH